MRAVVPSAPQPFFLFAFSHCDAWFRYTSLLEHEYSVSARKKSTFVTRMNLSCAMTQFVEIRMLKRVPYSETRFPIHSCVLKSLFDRAVHEPRRDENLKDNGQDELVGQRELAEQTCMGPQSTKASRRCRKAATAASMTPHGTGSNSSREF